MKNFYVLEPAEFFVAQRLAQERPDLRLYFPLSDRGVDLLAMREGERKPILIQVKESRLHDRLHSWHDLKADRLASADIFIFVTYIHDDTGKRTTFSKDFMVFPRQDLEGVILKKRLISKAKVAGGVYSFHFQFDGDEVFDIREGGGRKIDVSRFHSAWGLVDATPS